MGRTRNGQIAPARAPRAQAQAKKPSPRRDSASAASRSRHDAIMEIKNAPMIATPAEAKEYDKISQRRVPRLVQKPTK